MAVATASHNADMSVAANFNAYAGGYIDANIQAFGWIYTSQTGDVNPNTCAAPGSNSYAGFRVYKSNDGLTDYYMRIDYGRRSSVNGIMLKYQVGTGVNGSGTLTGQTSTAQEKAPAMNAGTWQSYMSGDAGRIMIAMDPWTGTLSDTGSIAFAIGRTCNTSGTPDSTGIEIFATKANAGSNTSIMSQYVPLSGTVPPVETGSWPVNMSTRDPATIGSSVLFGIPQVFGENGGLNPTLHVAVVDPNNASAPTGTITTLSLSLYGTSHTYLVTQSIGVNARNVSGRALFRYE